MSISSSIRDYSKLAGQMGPKWLGYRLAHLARTRLGLLRKRFPIAPPPPAAGYTSLAEFRQSPPKFFFAESRDEFCLPALSSSKGKAKSWARPNDKLRLAAQRILEGSCCYFSGESYTLGPADTWNTHPITGQTFPSCHWSDVPDMDASLGDIKYIWEPSRFGHFFILMRDEVHNGKDHAPVVMQQLEQWLEANPINQGPNYKCSQEISLRVLAWTFALHFYCDHPALTEPLWQRLQHNIAWSLHHVYEHIDFSRIAVRNNHAITECMLLWASGLLYPHLPNTDKYSAYGRRALLEELDYQVHHDGTYLQHSHNYQRVVVQLLTFALRLGELHDQALEATAYQHAVRMCDYLCAQLQPDGRLPNYGNNDGALFFPLATQAYRDYRPQLDALARACGAASPLTEPSEEAHWWGLADRTVEVHRPQNGTRSFPVGGIYTFRQNSFYVNLKCQRYRDRPGQSDNLHLDLWVEGENVLRDQGTYRYNADRELAHYFFGSRSHNTVMLGDFDQLRKGDRFTFYDWTNDATASWTSATTWRGSLTAFAHVAKDIRLDRRCELLPERNTIVVTDTIRNRPAHLPLVQWWHPHPDWLDRLSFVVRNQDQQSVAVNYHDGWYSDSYGQRTAVKDLQFAAATDVLTTTISWT